MSIPTVHDGRVVVVGGGVAGLITAFLLQESGVEVVVVERGDVLGGLARSYEHDGFVFDVGPHRFHTENPNVKALLDRIVAGDGTWFPRCSEVYFKGKYYRWPLKPSNLLQLPKPLATKAGWDLFTNSFKTYDTESFESYVLRQYGPTLYREFFQGYSQKFLGLHPRETHPDWAKVGINRAIIDDKVQMQNLSQLLKSTLLQYNKDETHFLYPTRGMQQAWEQLGSMFIAQGGRVILNQSAELVHEGKRITGVRAGSELIDAGTVIWTAPITVALEQLGHEPGRLPYLGLLTYNVCVESDVPRQYQWCYYGASDLLINRVSIPRFFSESTVPKGYTGLCAEVTCMEGDERWLHAERLSDWVVDDLIKVGMIKHRRDVHDVLVVRTPESYPIYHKNYTHDLERARKTLAQYDNLHLAGRTGMFWYNNMDHSIENAMQLSRRLLRDAGHTGVQETQLATGEFAASLG